MLKSHILSLSIVMLYIVGCILIFIFVVKTKMEAPDTYSLLLKLHTKLLNNSDNSREFQRGADVENTEAKLFKIQSLPPEPTHHPLEVPYPWNYQFLLNEPNKCLERTPFLVLLVVTEPKDFPKRYPIRLSWGNESLISGVSILRLFLIGVHPLECGCTSKPELQKLLIEESLRYRDIVQQDFLDTYNNLTLKTLMGMEWISKFCPNATYVMKADNDIFLNVEYLVFQLLQPHLPPKKDFITGCILRDKSPIRDFENKWYMPHEIYPNKTYPPYCAGYGYVLSGDLANKIYQVAQTIKVIHMEDVFIGICLHWLGINVTDSSSILGVNVTDSSSILGVNGIDCSKTFLEEKVRYEKCRFSKLVLVSEYRPQEMYWLWPHFWSQKKMC